MDRDIRRINIQVVSPDPGIDLIPREGPVGIADEKKKQIELLRREVELGVVSLHTPGFDIDLDPAVEIQRSARARPVSLS